MGPREQTDQVDLPSARLHMTYRMLDAEIVKTRLCHACVTCITCILLSPLGTQLITLRGQLVEMCRGRRWRRTASSSGTRDG